MASLPKFVERNKPLTYANRNEPKLQQLGNGSCAKDIKHHSLEWKLIQHNGSRQNITILGAENILAKEFGSISGVHLFVRPKQKQKACFDNSTAPDCFDKAIASLNLSPWSRGFLYANLWYSSAIGHS
jgi:hypothetical protein